RAGKVRRGAGAGVGPAGRRARDAARSVAAGRPPSRIQGVRGVNRLDAQTQQTHRGEQGGVTGLPAVTQPILPCASVRLACACPVSVLDSTASTTVAAVSVPNTLVMVRNMSGMRSSPRSSTRPVIGGRVAVEVGTRLTMLAEGTLATVSEARNTAAPAWNMPPSPSGTP